MHDYRRTIAALRLVRPDSGPAGHVLTELMHDCADLIEAQVGIIGSLQRGMEQVEEERAAQYDACVRLRRQLAEAEAECARIHRARS